MLARLGNLPQRHRSVALHAAVPDVDFRTSMWRQRIPGHDDPCSRNFLSHACHAKPPAIGIWLAEIAGSPRSWQRPARVGPRDWHNACGNCGNPRHGPPVRYRDRIEGGAERSETHSSGPIAVRKYSRVATGRESGATVLLLENSPAVWRANGNWRTSWVIRCTISRLGRGEAPRATGKIPNLFNAGKPQTPANGAYLFRPSASQRSDRDAEVGLFESEGLARRHARQLHPAHARDGDSGGVSPGHRWGNKGGKRNSRQPPPGRARCGGGRDGVPDAPLIRGPRGPYLALIPL
jgi:hypothetical protein